MINNGNEMPRGSRFPKDRKEAEEEEVLQTQSRMTSGDSAVNVLSHVSEAAKEISIQNLAI